MLSNVFIPHYSSAIIPTLNNVQCTKLTLYHNFPHISSRISAETLHFFSFMNLKGISLINCPEVLAFKLPTFSAPQQAGPFTSVHSALEHVITSSRPQGRPHVQRRHHVYWASTLLGTSSRLLGVLTARDVITSAGRKELTPPTAFLCRKLWP